MFIFGGRRINPMEYLHGIELFTREVDVLIKRGNKLEREGRDIAADNSGLIGERDEKWLEELDIYHLDLASLISDLANLLRLHRSLYVDVLEMRDCVASIYAIFKRLGIKGKPRSIHFLNPREVGEDKANEGKRMIEYLTKYDEVQMSWTGKKGIWLWGEIPPERYTWSVFVNDLTSSFHRFLLYISGVLGEYQPLTEKIYIHREANPYLVELAKMWYNSIKVLYSLSLMNGDDYDPTAAVVKENEIELAVGSAPGHLTHVELKPLGILVTYYDADDEVRYILGKLARDYGCHIIRDVSRERLELFCPRLTGAAENFMKYVLPLATSMDIRMYNPSLYWARHIPGFKEKLREMMYYAEPEDVEYWACKWFIENKFKKLLEEHSKKETE